MLQKLTILIGLIGALIQQRATDREALAQKDARITQLEAERDALLEENTRLRGEEGGLTASEEAVVDSKIDEALNLLTPAPVNTSAPLSARR